MSDDAPDEGKFIKWFMQSFPSETFFSREILKRLNDILYNVPIGSKKYVIDFTVEEIDNHLRFTTTDLGLVFLGVMGKCIVDIMAENFSTNMKSEITRKAKESVDSFLKQNHKVCKCGYYNDAKFHYCGLCGTNLDNQ